jgi:phosphomevalonate kinase
MRTRAPGKVVLSGAYSVLESAPAIVTAVSRYVEVDSEKPGTFLTEEVRAAGITSPYWFDASALRQGGRKLGLGSSAAILLATLAARALEENPSLNDPELRNRLFSPALTAHRNAQGGGSGIDVASSCFGGTLAFFRGDGSPRLLPLLLPRGLTLEVWSSTVEASTPGLIAKVKALAQNNPTSYRKLIDAQAAAAQAALVASQTDDALGFITAIDAQRVALTNLGLTAGAPIVTLQVENLAKKAARLGAAVIPAGAGGGDIALYVGLEPSTSLDGPLLEQGHERLDLTLGVEGVRSRR